MKAPFNLCLIALTCGVLTVTVRADRLYDDLVSQHEAKAKETAASFARYAEAEPAEVQAAEGASVAAVAKVWEERLAKPQAPAHAQSFVPTAVQERTRELATAADLPEQLAAGVDLDTLAGLVSYRNPGIEAARQAVTATRQQFAQSEQLDAILAQYSAFTKQLDTRISARNNKQMLAMSFPFPDTSAIKGRLVSEAVAIAEMDEAVAIRDAVTAARIAAYNLAYNDRALAVNEEMARLLEEAIAVGQSGIRTGSTKTGVVIMAQIELARLSDANNVLRQGRRALEGEVNALLNLPPESSLRLLDAETDLEPTAELPELTRLALANRQELQRQRLRVVRMESMIEMATRMAYPDPTTGVGYFEDRMRLGGSGAAVDGPAFMTRRDLDRDQAARFGERDAYIRESRLRTDAMKSGLRQMENQTALAIQTAFLEFETAKKSLSLYQQSLIPQADQALAGVMASYRAGKAEFVIFLEAERMALMVRLEAERARRTLRIQLARLEQLTGIEIKTHPLSLPEHLETEK